jgi:hypothetical protein
MASSWLGPGQMSPHPGRTLEGPASNKPDRVQFRKPVVQMTLVKRICDT